MKKIPVLVLLLFYTSAVYAQSAFELVKKDVDIGKNFLNEGKPKEAQKMFDWAIRRSKTKKYREGHPDTFILIGDAYLTCNSPNPDKAFLIYYAACGIDKKYCNKTEDPIFDAVKKEDLLKQGFIFSTKN